MINAEDAVIDLGACTASPPVLIEETVWLDNSIAAVHTGHGAVTVQAATFTASKVGLFSFGGELVMRDTQFEALAGSTLASCRHIGDCAVEMSRCVVTDSVSSSVISMCSGAGVKLTDSHFEGFKGGSLLTCSSVHEEQTHADAEAMVRDDGRCGEPLPCLTWPAVCAPLSL